MVPEDVPPSDKQGHHTNKEDPHCKKLHVSSPFNAVRHLDSSQASMSKSSNLDMGTSVLTNFHRKEERIPRHQVCLVTRNK